VGNCCTAVTAVDAGVGCCGCCTAEATLGTLGSPGSPGSSLGSSPPPVGVTQYVVIFRLNEGRVMTTGEPFTNPRLIRPGWVLDVPLPGYNVWTVGGHVLYRVRPDDSLWRIAESLLGDGFRWTEIWELNQGRVMSDGRRFTDPDLIQPGWILELPLEARTEAAVPPAEVVPALHDTIARVGRAASLPGKGAGPRRAISA